MPLLRDSFLFLSSSKRLGRVLTTSRIAWLGARRFVAGQTIDEAIEVLRGLGEAGMRATLDYLGENVTSREEAERACAAYLEALDRIRAAGVHSGVSLKLTALGMDLGDAFAEAQLERIVAHASRETPPLFVRVDMEGSAYTQRTLDLFARLRARHANVGVVIQSYLYRTAEDLERLIAMGAGVRLCKGAYLEPEHLAFPQKADVDANYIRLAERLLSAEARAAGVYPAFATHDARIIEQMKQFTRAEGISTDRFEFQMLYGIRRDLQAALIAEGFAVRIYVPYGGQWYPYFMRRLAERPENLGFILRNLARELRRGSA